MHAERSQSCRARIVRHRVRLDVDLFVGARDNRPRHPDTVAFRDARRVGYDHFHAGGAVRLLDVDRVGGEDRGHGLVLQPNQIAREPGRRARRHHPGNGRPELETGERVRGEGVAELPRHDHRGLGGPDIARVEQARVVDVGAGQLVVEPVDLPRLSVQGSGVPGKEVRDVESRRMRVRPILVDDDQEKRLTVGADAGNGLYRPQVGLRRELARSLLRVAEHRRRADAAADEVVTEMPPEHTEDVIDWEGLLEERAPGRVGVKVHPAGFGDVRRVFEHHSQHVRGAQRSLERSRVGRVERLLSVVIAELPLAEAQPQVFGALGGAEAADGAKVAQVVFQSFRRRHRLQKYLLGVGLVAVPGQIRVGGYHIGELSGLLQKFDLVVDGRLVHLQIAFAEPRGDADADGGVNRLHCVKKTARCNRMAGPGDSRVADVTSRAAPHIRAVRLVADLEQPDAIRKRMPVLRAHSRPVGAAVRVGAVVRCVAVFDQVGGVGERLRKRVWPVLLREAGSGRPFRPRRPAEPAGQHRLEAPGLTERQVLVEPEQRGAGEVREHGAHRRVVHRPRERRMANGILPVECVSQTAAGIPENRWRDLLKHCFDRTGKPVGGWIEDKFAGVQVERVPFQVVAEELLVDGLASVRCIHADRERRGRIDGDTLQPPLRPGVPRGDVARLVAGFDSEVVRPRSKPGVRVRESVRLIGVRPVQNPGLFSGIAARTVVELDLIQVRHIVVVILEAHRRRGVNDSLAIGRVPAGLDPKRRRGQVALDLDTRDLDKRARGDVHLNLELDDVVDPVPGLTKPDVGGFPFAVAPALEESPAGLPEPLEARIVNVVVDVVRSLAEVRVFGGGALEAHRHRDIALVRAGYEETAGTHEGSGRTGSHPLPTTVLNSRGAETAFGRPALGARIERPYDVRRVGGPDRR